MTALLRVGPLPDEALAAAARFHAEVLPRALAELAKGADLVLVFGAADHTHRGWRLAAVQQLARTHAPLRVNALAGGDDAAIAAALRYLGTAAGITGQMLPLDSEGACDILYDTR